MNAVNYSVATTVFNDSKGIVQFLSELCAQTMKPSEIVIADGGSKDDTVALIRGFASDAPVPVRVVEGKRLNIAQGFNEAIRNCAFDWVALVGVGNRLDARCFEELAHGALAQDAAAAYCPIRGLAANRFQALYKNAFLNGDKGNDLGIASNHGALVRKDALIKAGLFYEKFVYAGEDAEFFARIREMGFKAVCVPGAITLWDTPRSLREYLKQRRYYKIADMQILGPGALRGHLKTAAFCLAPVVGLALLFFDALRWAGWAVLIAFAAALVYAVLRKGARVAALWLFAKYLSLWQLVRYAKYMKREYRIGR